MFCLLAEINILLRHYLPHL